MISAIVVAGGEGERLGRQGGKQLVPLRGVPMLARTVRALTRCGEFDEIVVVCHAERVTEYREAVESEIVGTLAFSFVAGGETRQDSVAAGLAAVSSAADIIVVHDGARPLVTGSIVSSTIAALRQDAALDGAVVGHPSVDTVKAVAPDGIVQGTLDRTMLWTAQTPQAFRAGVLRAAYDAAARDRFVGTDDSSLVERTGGLVRMIEAPRDNLKVTVAADIVLAEAVLAARDEGG